MKSENAVWLKISGIAGIVTPVVTLTFVISAIASYPQFSWVENALSDLGVKPGLTAPLFNYGLVVSGFLALVFALGLFIFFRRRILGRIGVPIFILAALAFVAIGVFPENVSPRHYYVSVAFFVFFPVSMLVLAANFFVMDEVKMGIFTLLVAIAAIVPWVLYFSIRFVPGVAIPEAVSALSASVWAIVIGSKMVKQASRSNV